MTKNLSPRQFSLFRHSSDGTVQAPMFASPREIMASKPVLGDTMPNDSWRVAPSGRTNDGFESLDSLKSRKLEESHDRLIGGKTLFDSIKEGGVKEPLTVSSMPPHPLDEPEAGPHIHVLDGHHRLFSALESRPDDPILLDHNYSRIMDQQITRMNKPRRYPGQKF